MVHRLQIIPHPRKGGVRVPKQEIPPSLKIPLHTKVGEGLRMGALGKIRGGADPAVGARVEAKAEVVGKMGTNGMKRGRGRRGIKVEVRVNTRIPKPRTRNPPGPPLPNRIPSPTEIEAIRGERGGAAEGVVIPPIQPPSLPEMSFASPAWGRGGLPVTPGKPAPTITRT